MFLLVEYNKFDRNLAPSQMQGCRLVFKGGGGGGVICGYFCVRAWVLFVNTMFLLSWLATQKPKSCTLPTQSAIASVGCNCNTCMWHVTYNSIE